MNKSLWKPLFTKHQIPRYPCPKCQNGHLRIKNDSLLMARPRYVTLEMIEQDNMSAPHRFVLLLECNESTCGEVISVCGEALDLEHGDADGSSEISEVLQPMFMRPAPPIIQMPKGLPLPTIREIGLAFELFWVDYSVCASRLRTSLERLMDHFGVARFRRQPGKRRQLDLASRIDKLPKKIKTHDYTEILHALRTIGNLGTHGAKVNRAAVLDAFQLYEMALGELFKDKSESAKAIIGRLKAFN